MEPEPQAGRSDRQWQPLTAVQRRVAGVLVEKAKTTPDAYPLTLNALRTGCNQKSNRSPQMNLTVDEIQLALDQLREMGAVAEVQSGSRAPKYRHYLYEWLAVDKVELAVMTELLLRAEQTLGELRSRAARMEPISDLQALKPVVSRLIERDLVVSLSPAGRGQMVTHGLYHPDKLEALKQRYQSGRPPVTSQSHAPPAAPAATEELARLREELADLKGQLDVLRSRVDRLENTPHDTA